jgi:demethylmenaquinone methyltransferase/2-methoxy-6-polyprenyl-1,4-benzoquinol methylase
MNDPSKEKRVHETFEKVSANYDFMNSVISFCQHKRWRKDVMKRMNVSLESNILDVCCGTGDWTISLDKRVGKDGKVTGIDFSEKMLSVAKRKAHKAQLNQIEWVNGNAMSLPFEDNYFDYVTIGFGLRNVPNYMTVLKEMRRVVKPKGKVVCLETSQPTLIVWRQLYYFYFKLIMPLLGGAIVKSYKEYSWLQESAKDFPKKQELTQMFLDAGFERVDTKSYAGGVVAMHLGYN